MSRQTTPDGQRNTYFEALGRLEEKVKTQAEQIKHQVAETDDLRKRIRVLEGPKLEPGPGKCKLCGQAAGYHEPDCLGATE